MEYTSEQIEAAKAAGMTTEDYVAEHASTTPTEEAASVAETPEEEATENPVA